MDVFKLFLIVSFVVIPLVGVVLALRMLVFRRHAVRTKAKIVAERSEASRSGDFDTVHIYTVEYLDHRGRKQRGELLAQGGRSRRNSPVDGYVSILFDKRRPTNIDYDDWRTRWIVPVTLMLPGVLAIGFLGFAYVTTR